MFIKVSIILMVSALVSSEPPVTGYNYQPPSYNGYNQLNTQYGPPSTGFQPPSPTYLPPVSIADYSSSGSSYNPSSSNYNTPDTHYNPVTPGYNTGNSGYNTGNSGYNTGNTGYNPGNAGYNVGSTSYNSPHTGNGGYDYSGGDSYDNSHDHHHGHDSEVPKSYEFGYSVKDAQSGNDYNRHESSDGNTVRGEYRVQLPDGRLQIVTYHADWKTGYHADVRYEGEAKYPEPTYNNQQGGYNYKAPSDYSGSLTGLSTQNGGYAQPSTAYGPPGYHR